MLSPACTGTRWDLVAALLVAATCSLTACDSAPAAPGPLDPCAHGDEVTLDGQTLCTARLGETDTGFVCPTDMTTYGTATWAACSPTDTFSDEAVEQAVIAGDGLACGPMKVDLLVVIDPSTSMSDEQIALQTAFVEFAEELGGYAAELRVATTSMDHGCTVPDVASAQGVFNETASTVTGPTDRYQRVVACATEADCEAELGVKTAWVCDRPSEDACISNPNGSPNSRCRQVCEDDTDCTQALGDTAVCEQISLSLGDNGCILPPPTVGCATATGPVLEADALDDFACIAVMPDTKLGCFAHSEGMRAAWSALDPAGANAAQSDAFLRSDAMLAVVFISETDDCSLAPGETMPDDQAARCGQLADTTDAGPLWPTSELHDALVALKGDPAMVTLLTIAGDSLGADDAEVQSDRADYATSVTDPLDCYAGTHICSTGASTAQLGSRWLELAGHFGDAGAFHNVCSPEGIGTALHELLVTTGRGWLDACSPL